MVASYILKYHFMEVDSYVSSLYLFIHSSQIADSYYACNFRVFQLSEVQQRYLQTVVGVKNNNY